MILAHILLPYGHQVKHILVCSSTRNVTIVDTVGSDHRPMIVKAKDVKFVLGMYFHSYGG